MTEDSNPEPHRLHGLMEGMRDTTVLACSVALVETAWIASEESISLLHPHKEVIPLGLAYTLVLSLAMLLLRLAWRWSDPLRPLQVLFVASALWVVPYHLGWTGWTPGWIALAAVLAWGYGMLNSGWRFAMMAVLAVPSLAWQYEWFQGERPEPLQEDLPNVVVVVIDTLRADRLGCYGHQPDGFRVSPMIDALATRGTLFENALAQAPWTRPSTASLFSSLYPASHRIVTPYDPLGAEVPTLATMLAERGYRTAAFSANPQVSPSFGFHHGFEHFWSATANLFDHSAGGRLVRRWGRTLGLAEKPVRAHRGVAHATADDVNEAVFAWADKAEEDPDIPTFLYVHYLDPHDPYSAPEDLLGMPAGPDISEEPLYASQELPPYPLEGSSLVDLGTEQMRELKRRYDTEIRFVDNRLADLLDDLRARGLYGDEDWLILTSDHGEEFHEHEQWQHGRSLFEEMVRVPLIVVGPTAPKGVRLTSPVGLIDVLPTVASVTGGAPDFPIHGLDLFAEPYARPGGAVLTHRPRELHPIWGLRTIDRKLIWVMDGERHVELAYDLRADPGEQRPLDIEGDPSWQAMRRELEILVETSGDLASGGAHAVELDPEMARKLEQLGYIDGAEEDDGTVDPH